VDKSSPKGGQKMVKNATSSQFTPQASSFGQIAKLLLFFWRRKDRKRLLRRYAPRNDKLVAYGKTIAGNNQSADYAD